MTWDPEAPSTAPPSVRSEFSAMVARVEAAIAGSGAGYTPRIRGAEQAFELVAQRHVEGGATREQVSDAIKLVEEAWMVNFTMVQRQGARR